DAIAAVAPVHDDAGFGLGAHRGVHLQELAGEADDFRQLMAAMLQAFRGRRHRRGIGGQVNQGNAVGDAHFSMMYTKERVEPIWMLPVVRTPSSICLSSMVSISSSSLTGLPRAVWTTI